MENDYDIIDEIDIYDSQGNKFVGKTYIKELNTIKIQPSLVMIKLIYGLVSEGWRDVDESNKLFVYNNEHTLLGSYDGKIYKDNSTDSEVIINLGHPSPFLKKLQEREPTLFIKEDSQAFSQYSKLCPWNIRRYPIILTKEEKDVIDKETPGAYHSSIEYGTDPKKKFYYICPQYWNLRTNKPVPKEDVDPSKVIGQKETNPDLSKKYIFEFSTQSHGHYAVPSFLDKKSHPQGHFIPCCFKLNKKGEIPKAQLKRIEEAAAYMAKLDNTQPKQNKNVLEEEEEISEYIQNGLKFPLPNKRKGELTVTLETFFGLNHTLCYSNLKTKKPKINYPCLFRKGVENNKNQSFLAVLAEIYKYSTIAELKEVIVKNITIDNIQEFHNGQLSHTFSKKNYFDQDISPYMDSELYTKMEGNEEGFKKIVSGLIHFHKFIMDNDVVIDHTYLWDIVCSGILKKTNKKTKIKQLNKRVNLIILNETMDDVTQNINILCPTTFYSKFLFNLSNPSYIIYKKGDYYEPLINYLETEDHIYENNFQFKITEELPFMKNILEAINTSLGECNGTIINKYYTFKKSIPLIELLSEIDKLEQYSVKTQIMNYDGKIIALIVEYKLDDKIRTFYVPCAPSNKENMEYELISDSHWKNYSVTVKYLKKLYIDSNKKIPCLPKFRVIDKSLIVGVLTITNQFIMLKTPEENKYHDELKDLNDHHYIHFSNEDYVNYDFELKNKKLVKEQDVISYLKLEQQFYNAYFTTLKDSINNLKNILIRKQIEEILQNADMPYKEQFVQIKKIIEGLLYKFEFIDYEPNVLKEIVEINICKHNKSNYCKQDGTLLIPTTNLFTGEKNEVTYLHKFIDNLIRNHNIQVSIFEESHSTIYYTNDYNLSETEILILESALIPYLDSLGEVVKKNEYIEFRGLEDLTPNEIFQLLENDIAENEKSSENLKLSYETNNESEPEEPINNFGIEPDQEVNHILKQAVENKESELEEVEPLKAFEVEKEDELEEELKENELQENVNKTPETENELEEESKQEEELEKEKEKAESVKAQEDEEETVGELENESISEDEEEEQEEKLEEAEKEEDEEEQVEEDEEEQVEENDSISEEEEKVEEEETSSKNNSQISLNSSVNPNKKIKFKSVCNRESENTNFYKQKLNNGNHKCIHKQYLSLLWYKYFKKQSTVWLNFGIKSTSSSVTTAPSTQCNYFLMSLILKECNREEFNPQYSTNYVNHIKQLLIEGYKNLINDNNILNLIKKWKKNGKTPETTRLLTKSKSFTENIELIINSPDYRLTVTDLLIFMCHYKIPIILLYQSKKTETYSGIKICYTTDNDYYYLIRVQNKTYGDYNEYTIFSLHLWSNGKNSKKKLSTIRYFINNPLYITPKLLNEIEKQNNKYTFDTYLETKEL